MFEVKSIEYFTHKNEPAYQGIFSNVSRTQSLAHKAAFSLDKFTQFWQKICSLQWNEIAYCLRNNDLNLGLFFWRGEMHSLANDFTQLRLEQMMMMTKQWKELL